MADSLTILFTAFEPSGDALAAAVIAELKRREPDCTIYALGGPRMAAAGAELLETTTGHAAMLADAARQMFVHRRRLQHLSRWLSEHRVDAVVPTDSPAANWSVCKLTRRLQPAARIVHLVMPQLWAWASWRLNKLRRLSDHVLCLLPFEQQWLAERGVRATFVGHPLYEATPAALAGGDVDGGAEAARPAHEAALPSEGEPKLALLPGSRRSEIKANWPTMLAAYEILRKEYPRMRACVAASDAERLAQLETLLPTGTGASGGERHGGEGGGGDGGGEGGGEGGGSGDGGRWPAGISVLSGNATAVLDWSDVALVVSGTATLHAASRRRPMVVLYNINRWGWSLVGRWVVATRTFSLPNLIAERMEMGRVVPELVPHFGAVEPVVDALRPLMREGEAREHQCRAFDAMTRCFQRQGFAATAVDALLNEVGRPALPR